MADELERIGDLRLELLDAFDSRGELVPIAHQFLRGRGVVPEIGIFGAVVQLIKSGDRNIPVKDASSAARRTARSAG
jgi:hypothetical protein